VFVHRPEPTGNPIQLWIEISNVGTGPAIDCRYAAVYYSGRESTESGGFVSDLVVIPTGASAKSSTPGFFADESGLGERKHRANILFGGNEAVGQWVHACGSDGSFVREMVWCSDVLGGHWWFARRASGSLCLVVPTV
jgi:hypothetical protein